MRNHVQWLLGTLDRLSAPVKPVNMSVLCTHVTGDVCVSTGRKDRNCIPLHLKPLGLFFFPIVLVAVLQRDNKKNPKHEYEENLMLVQLIRDTNNYFTYFTQVEGVNSRLNKEGIIRGQGILGLCHLILGLVIDLKKRKRVVLEQM